MILPERTILRDEVRMRDLLNLLRSGGVIIYPTETIYSIGGALSSSKATETIFSIKNRNPHDALFAIVFDLRQAEAFTVIRYDIEKHLFDTYGRLGLTVLLDARPVVASAPRGGQSTLGIRLATTQLTRYLTQRVAEPLTCISASLSNNLIPDPLQGDVIPTDLAHVPESLQEKVDCVIEAERQPSGKPSTIIRVESERRIVLIREGVLPIRELERLDLDIEVSQKTG